MAKSQSEVVKVAAHEVLSRHIPLNSIQFNDAFVEALARQGYSVVQHEPTVTASAEEFADEVVERLTNRGVAYDFWSVGDGEPMSPKELLVRGYEAGVTSVQGNEGERYPLRVARAWAEDGRVFIEAEAPRMSQLPYCPTCANYGAHARGCLTHIEGMADSQALFDVNELDRVQNKKLSDG